MKQEKKQRKFHEALLKMLYPPPPSPSPSPSPPPSPRRVLLPRKPWRSRIVRKHTRHRRLVVLKSRRGRSGRGAGRRS
ncbi:uncharacterized protein LOC127240724 [Andrographis paniculata]|uniref:uncharacterized protein LOC127240724 n=1 Tax=Andrographis paniculata TaxID=175694 RepID=UPI0021E827BE|nr:uncharacterized protein LOC127240724 [Andrographis paniculata]